MGHIISYIIASIVASFISGFLLLGIPFGVLLEMKGLGDYMYALTIVIASVFELIWFFGNVFVGGEISFNPKKIFTSIKSFFKKDKKEEKNKKKSVDQGFSFKSNMLYIIEGVILVVIAIYAINNPQHSSVANIIYNGTIIKILASLFLPLLIINTINMIVDMGGGIFTSIGSQLGGAVMALVLGFIISTGMLFVASVWYTDIEASIKKSWFIYDNPNFDEMRGNSFNATEYLKSSYQGLIEEQKPKMSCNLNESACKERLKVEVNRLQDVERQDIRTYGYKFSKRLAIDDNRDALCITDMKTRKNMFYIIDYINFSFTESTVDEYNNYATAK